MTGFFEGVDFQIFMIDHKKIKNFVCLFKTLHTEALEAFRTGMSYRFVQWLNQNSDVFTAHKASLGFIWA